MDSGESTSAERAAGSGHRPRAGARQDVAPTESAQVLMLRCRATPASLRTVHEAVTRFWDRPSAQPPACWRMLFELAVAEIAANILEHARPAVLGLHLCQREGSVVAEFTDRGGGWAGPPPGPAAIGAGGEADLFAERGRGLSLARTAVDEVVYERDGALNRWRLLKWL